MTARILHAESPTSSRLVDGIVELKMETACHNDFASCQMNQNCCHHATTLAKRSLDAVKLFFAILVIVSDHCLLFLDVGD